MALTADEEKRLLELETKFGSSVMSPNYQPPGFLDQLKTSTIENLPAMGGMAGGVLGGFLTRSAPGAELGSVLGSQAIRSMVGAGFGGATGEATKQAITGRPSATSLLRGGIEQALYDGAGNLIISYGGKAISVAKNTLFKQFAGKPPADASVAAQKLLLQGDGTLTQFQATGNTWAGFKESVARGSFVGRPVLEEATKKNILAIDQAKQKALDEVSTRIYDSLQTGKEFSKAIEEGDAALKTLTRPFYEALDKAPKVAQAPVLLGTIKQDATKVLEAADAIGGLTLGAQERALLTSMSALPDNIGFAQAHEIASSLKTRLRDLKKNVSEPDSQTVFRLSKLVNDIEKQMDVAGSKFSGTAIPFEGRLPGEVSTNLADQYKFYSKFYRDAITDLYSDTAAKLLDKDPEFVGKTIFQNGNVTAWTETKQALLRAKKLNPELNVEQTLASVQRGYLENLLKSDSSFAKLGDKLQNDETLRRTFETILPTDVQKRVTTLLNAAKLSTEAPEAAAPLFFAAQQAQAVSTLGSVALLTFNDEAKNVAAENPIKTTLLAGAIVLGPRFMAKAATSPEATNAALGLLKASRDELPIGKNLLLKASTAFEKVGITAEDLTGKSETIETPVGLDPAEEERLRQLEEKYGPQQ